MTQLDDLVNETIRTNAAVLKARSEAREDQLAEIAEALEARSDDDQSGYVGEQGYGNDYTVEMDLSSILDTLDNLGLLK